jgi:hypothetical protein
MQYYPAVDLLAREFYSEPRPRTIFLLHTSCLYPGQVKQNISFYEVKYLNSSGVALESVERVYS